MVIAMTRTADRPRPRPPAASKSRPPADPLHALGLAGFADAFRGGRLTSEAVTKAYLERIAAYDGRLGAYELVTAENALATARAIDRLREAGTDLGPLMGVPVAVKDLLAVEGFPVTAGSNLDVADYVGPEGPFVRLLKRAGCVILGKSKTVEFAMGGTGINLSRGTPWNPWDSAKHRIPGGSSSGSAVAAVAGLCGFAIGTDTGGSVRITAVSGAVGLKTTKGLWPTDGVSSLSRTVDTIGPMARTVADAAHAFAALTGEPAPLPADPRTLRLGRPRNHFFDDLDPEVAACTEAAIARLRDAGATVVDVDIPELVNCQPVIRTLVTVDFLASFGRERFLAERPRMDADMWQRLSPGLDFKGDDYARALWAHERLRAAAHERLRDLDGWIMPTNPMLAPTVAQLGDPGGQARYVDRMGRNTYPANLMGLCALTLPVQGQGAPLPVGF
ncbi:MAG: amidase, partial [Alphaproteobacteria bacterium]|nr:amidase [Alphaproteobacteria bacterium]